MVINTIPSRPFHGIIWPDRHNSERYTDERLESAGIRVLPVESYVAGEPVEQPTPVIAEATPVITDVAPETTPVVTETTPVVTESEPEPETESESVNEAQAIRDYLASNPDAANKDVVAALAEKGITIQSSQVSREKKNLADAA